MEAPNDIIVVGAGIVGCAVAYELASRGASVEVVDDRPAGMGATQASAGMLAPYLEAHEGSPLLDLAVRGLDVFDAFVECVVEIGGVPVAYQRTGTLDVAQNVATMERLGRVAPWLASRGVDVELLDANAVREREPHLAGDVLGGLLVPAHGFIAAYDFTRALAAAARRRGARILEQGRVRRVARSRHGLVVETDRGSLTGDAVVIAGGSWSGEIEIEGGAVRIPVRPVRGQLLHLGWTGPALARVTWNERCYLVPWADGTLLVGATVEEAGFDERATAAGVHELIEAAASLVPHAGDATFRAARAGLRPGTPDGLPIIGACTRLPNLMFATGHYRSGVLLAPLTARLVADAMLDGRIDPLLEATRPQRFGDV